MEHMKTITIGNLLVQVGTGFVATATQVDNENCEFREYGNLSSPEVLSITEVLRNISNGTFKHYRVIEGSAA